MNTMSKTSTSPNRRQPQPTPPPLLTENEAARFLSLTPRALQAWRCQGRGPRYVKISARAVRYRLDDLEQWVNDRLRSSTCDPGPPGR